MKNRMDALEMRKVNLFLEFVWRLHDEQLNSEDLQLFQILQEYVTRTKVLKSIDMETYQGLLLKNKPYWYVVE